MLKDLDLMLLAEHLAVLRTGDRDAIEQRMLEMATALEPTVDMALGLSSADRLVQSYLSFLNSTDVNELPPEVHAWLLEFIANRPYWINSEKRSFDRAGLVRLFAGSDDAAVRAMLVAALIAGDQKLLGDRDVREAKLVFTPALWHNLREVIEDRSVISSRIIELIETLIDLWIVPENHELAGRCLEDLFGYLRQTELIAMEQITSLVAERAEEIGGQLGEALSRISQSQ